MRLQSPAAQLTATRGARLASAVPVNAATALTAAARRVRAARHVRSIRAASTCNDPTPAHRHRFAGRQPAPHRRLEPDAHLHPGGPPFHPQLHVAEFHAEGGPLRRQPGHVPAARLPLLQVVEIAVEQHLQRARRRAGPDPLLHGQREPGRRVREQHRADVGAGRAARRAPRLRRAPVRAALAPGAVRARLAALLCVLHHRASDRRLGDHHRLAPQTARRPRARRRLWRLVRRDARGLVPDEVPRRGGRRDRGVGADLAARGHRAARDARHASSGDHARRERGGRRDRPVPRQPARGVAVDPAGRAHAPRPSAALRARRRLP